MRFDIPEQKKLVHEMRIPIRWGDMDAMGHVNNTIYFRFFEIVRLDWFFRVAKAHGITRLDVEGVIIVNAFCSFIRQLEFPGEVLARFYVANLGREPGLLGLQRRQLTGADVGQRRRRHRPG